MMSNTHYHPDIYIPVPESLRTQGLITLPVHEELPIYSTTALDEIHLKVPDALFNGQAVVNLFKSCIPDISDPWRTPNTLLNYLLVAIRIASDGDNLEMSVTCPYCKAENTYGIQLSNLLETLSNISLPEYLNIEPNVTVYFKSIDYKDLTAFNIRYFSNQKNLNQIKKLVDEEEQSKLYINLINETNNLNILWVASHISSIIYDNAEYLKIEDILQLLTDCDRQLFETIKKPINETNNKLTPRMNFICASCEHSFATSLSLDYCHLFRQSLIDKDESEIREIATQFEKDIGVIKKDLMDCVWYLRGGMSYTEVLRLNHKERKIIAKIVDEHMKVTKETKHPFF